MKPIVLVAILATGCAFCPGETAKPSNSTPSAPIVTVNSGKLRGALAADGGAVFKGIPYAQPPVGELRWREPVPAKPWTGIREATAFSPQCIQDGPGTSSEDCLYLNVWTPQWPMKQPAAVMVWIHGGGNFAGTGADPVTDGAFLARHGVVVVSINYRLGIFGFFEHPELEKESPHHVSGNYGILDQIEALRWVHRNIASFGGDPSRVTIFGESAGSLDVNILMATPLSKGLFQRVIGESGAIAAPPSLAEGEKTGAAVAARLNITGPDSLKKLRAASSGDLQKATGPGLAYLGMALGLVVDGWVFPESPQKAFAAGREQKVALMLGSNSQELQHPFFPMQGGLRETLGKQYGPLADRALAVYSLNGDGEPQPDPQYGTAMAQWATDTQFRCPSVRELIWHTGAGNTAYEFQFSRSHHRKPAEGASHASEIPFVFGTLPLWQEDRLYTDADRTASEQMAEYWTNFAKTGDPNGGDLVQWPKFDPAARSYLDITDNGMIAKQALRQPACDLYIENQKRQMAK